jgi:hypothetical protein
MVWKGNKSLDRQKYCLIFVVVIFCPSQIIAVC